ncbi:hypothetical protein FEM48_Zijuj08G0103400 [Ziziphus jujuba var. spinosa]|uniref:Transcription repressor n=1 Tax=Ziziphus jujuba var. spinosa TaxID=714518 RepID=A0A978UYJ0_ZIZJJ|nr:hypothetical protein FEM48_Zijuj08G0103400 [Ziziphus jujuba var. spinosa]
MAKRFRLRISRVIPSFQSCRSKETTALPTDPVPSFNRLSPVNATAVNLRFPTTTTPPRHSPPPPSSNKHYSSLKRHVSAFVSVGCGTRSKPTHSDDDSNEGPEFHWEKEEKWHVVAKVYNETPRRKIYNSSVSGCSDRDDDVLPPPPPPPSSAEKKKRRVKKKKTPCRLRISTSSAESGLFSSDGFNDVEDEETETLVSSSRSFSTDSSSEFNPHLETIREVTFDCPRRKKSRVKKVKNKNKKPKRYVSKGERKTRNNSRKSGGWSPSPESESPARLSMFQRLIPCTVEGKVRESFAVVKKSEDPYVDFKRSMMEMILEKQMFDDKDLEQLLHCFLSLNSRQHHGIIVQAFSEIWDTLFCTTTTSRRVSRAL